MDNPARPRLRGEGWPSAGPVRGRLERTATGPPTDCVLSTDEKTSIQARRRIHATVPPAPGTEMRVEHEYQRMGAWAYLAAWDVRRAKIHGRCERKTGIVPFERLVDQVMRQKPYCSAPRVFWIMDNGSSHRGKRCAERLSKRWPTIVPVHTPVCMPTGSIRSRSTSPSCSARR